MLSHEINDFEVIDLLCYNKRKQETSVFEMLQAEIERIEQTVLSANDVSPRLKQYCQWLFEIHDIPKSYRSHPIESEAELNALKVEFSKVSGSSIGKYIRFRRVKLLLQQSGENRYQYINTPIGLMCAIDTPNGICLLDFCDRKSLPTSLSRYYEQIGGFIFETSDRLELLKKELDLYFKCKLKVFSVPLDLMGTDFQKEVWAVLSEIPYGEVCSYKEEATQYGNVHAIRAVANANGKNNISIIIPCHRVVASDGKLAGYGGGVWRKQFLIELEKNTHPL